VTSAFNALSAEIAHNVSSSVVASQSRSAAKKAVDALPSVQSGKPSHELQKVRDQAETAVRLLTQKATLVAVQKSLAANAREAAITAARAAFAQPGGKKRWTSVRAAAMKALKTGSKAARDAARAATEAAAATVAGEAADQSARLAAVHDATTTAVGGVDAGKVRASAMDAIMAVTTAKAAQEVPRLAAALGMSSPGDVARLEKSTAEAIYATMLKPIVPVAVSAGMTAAKKAAEDAAWSVLKAGTGSKGRIQEQTAIAASNAASEAAIVAVKSAAAVQAQQKLRSVSARMTIGGIIQNQGKAALTESATRQAKANLATDVASATVAWAMREVVPAAAKNTMQRAVHRVSLSDPDTRHITQALGPAEEALVISMQDAAREAAKQAALASVTAQAKAMVRASIDRVISMKSTSESPNAIATRAAIATVRSACMDQASVAARAAAKKSIEAAGNMLAVSKLRKALNVLRKSSPRRI